MQDVGRTIISQYSASPTLVQVIENLNNNLDPTPLLDSFYNLVWNVHTAVGWGLDVWGRIVGVSRVLAIGSSKFFGFNEATAVSADPWNQSPFYSGRQLSTNFILSDEGFRVLILAKALANICSGSIPAINEVLLLLFPGRGNAYVIDNLDMSMVYFFDFELSAVEQAIVYQSGVLPRPAGVSASVESSFINRVQLEDSSGAIGLENNSGSIQRED